GIRLVLGFFPLLTLAGVGWLRLVASFITSLLLLWLLLGVSLVVWLLIALGPGFLLLGFFQGIAQRLLLTFHLLLALLLLSVLLLRPPVGLLRPLLRLLLAVRLLALLRVAGILARLVVAGDLLVLLRFVLLLFLLGLLPLPILLLFVQGRRLGDDHLV